MEPIRSRAVLLPTMVDPFLLTFWIRQFKRIWYDEVDALYISAFSPIIRNPDVRKYLNNLLKDPKIYIIWDEEHRQHGDAINALLEVCKEKHIMLIEDDAFVFKRGVIGNNFIMLENGTCDVIGSKRGSCSPEILTKARELWGIPETGYGDNGCNFWPCFFFSERQTLLDTDRNFNARMWKKGEKIDMFGEYTAETDLAGDTFVNTSLQLHAKGLRVHYVPQYHGNTTDIEDYQANTGLFNGFTYWLHVGSLSSGMDGVLMDDEGRCLARHFVDPPKGKPELPPHCNTDMEKIEWERRVQWWLTFHEKAPTLEGDMLELHNLYGKAIDQVIVGFGLGRKHITIRQRIFEGLMPAMFL